jgi:hypothetical protein
MLNLIERRTSYVALLGRDEKPIRAHDEIVEPPLHQKRPKSEAPFLPPRDTLDSLPSFSGKYRH